MDTSNRRNIYTAGALEQAILDRAILANVSEVLGRLVSRYELLVARASHFDSDLTLLGDMELRYLARRLLEPRRRLLTTEEILALPWRIRSLVEGEGRERLIGLVEDLDVHELVTLADRIERVWAEEERELVSSGEAAP